MIDRRSFFRSVIAGSGMILVPQFADAFRWKKEGLLYRVWNWEKGGEGRGRTLRLGVEEVGLLPRASFFGAMKCLEPHLATETTLSWVTGGRTLGGATTLSFMRFMRHSETSLWPISVARGLGSASTP